MLPCVTLCPLTTENSENPSRGLNEIKYITNSYRALLEWKDLLIHHTYDILFHFEISYHPFGVFVEGFGRRKHFLPLQLQEDNTDNERCDDEPVHTNQKHVS